MLHTNASDDTNKSDDMQVSTIYTLVEYCYISHLHVILWGNCVAFKYKHVRHVIYSYEPWYIRMSHVTRKWVMSHTTKHDVDWVMSHMNESCPMNHVTYEWVMSRESCHIWMSHVPSDEARRGLWVIRSATTNTLCCIWKGQITCEKYDLHPGWVLLHHHPWCIIIHDASSSMMHHHPLAIVFTMGQHFQIRHLLSFLSVLCGICIYTNATCHVWMGHVMYGWVAWHINEPCRI